MSKVKENWSLFIPVIVILVSMLALPWLPNRIPLQVSANGEVGLQVPSLVVILILPLLQYVIVFYNWQRRNRVQTITILLFVSLAQLILIGFLLTR